jgi:tetratricopeptide (TPR) repeat protein
MTSQILNKRLKSRIDELVSISDLEALRRTLADPRFHREFSKSERYTACRTAAYAHACLLNFSYAAELFEASIATGCSDDQTLFDCEDAKFRANRPLNPSVLDDLNIRHPTNPHIFSLWANTVLTQSARQPSDLAGRLMIVLKANPQSPLIWLTAARLHEAAERGGVSEILNSYPAVLDEDQHFLMEMFAITARAGLFDEADEINKKIYRLNSDNCGEMTRGLKLMRMQDNRDELNHLMESLRSNSIDLCSAEYGIELARAANALNLPTEAISVISLAKRQASNLRDKIQLAIQESIALWEQDQQEAAIACLESLLAESTADTHELRYRLSHLYLSQLEIGRGGCYYAERFLVEKPVKLLGTVYGLPRFDLKIPVDSNVIVWGEQGIGEQLFFLKGAMEWLETQPPLTLLVDPKLKKLVQTVLGTRHNVQTIGKTINVTSSTRQISLGELFFAINATGKNYNEYEVSKLIRQRLESAEGGTAQEGRVGVSVYSRGASPLYGERKSIQGSRVLDFATELQKPILFLDPKEHYHPAILELLGSDSRRCFIEDFDPYLDLYALARTIIGMTEVITVSNTNAHIASFVGKKTIVFCSAGSARYWYWASPKGSTQSYWYSSTKVIQA